MASLGVVSAASVARSRMRVAIVGGGVVGGGVVQLLAKRGEALAAQHGVAFDVKYVAVKDVHKPRDFVLPPGAQLVPSTHLPKLATDQSLDMVVEVAGGDPREAASFLIDCLRNQKHVVTANKAALAAHQAEIEAAAKQSGAPISYEAAIAGCIPIVRVLQSSLCVDTVTGVRGIVNGTSNYILTAMAAGGSSYADALAAAQAAGFAETDPTGDVEGHDALNKLVLLLRLAFGVIVPPGYVPLCGMSRVEPADFAAARDLGGIVKLVADGAVDGDGVRGYVGPAIVPAAGALGSTPGAMNIVEVTGDDTGTTTYRGAGAGRFPTASAVLSDMVNSATGRASVKPFPRYALTGEAAPTNLRDTTAAWLVRTVGGRRGPNIHKLAERLTTMRSPVVQLRMTDEASGAGWLLTRPGVERSLVRQECARLMHDAGQDNRGMVIALKHSEAAEIGASKAPSLPPHGHDGSSHHAPIPVAAAAHRTGEATFAGVGATLGVLHGAAAHAGPHAHAVSPAVTVMPVLM